jgi:hypothetical protein
MKASNCALPVAGYLPFSFALPAPGKTQPRRRLLSSFGRRQIDLAAFLAEFLAHFGHAGLRLR